MATPTLVSCPGLCGPTSCGQQVAAHGLADFSATTVSVDACQRLLAQGWEGPQLVLRKSQADSLLPAPAPAVRHRDGLVTFVGVV